LLIISLTLSLKALFKGFLGKYIFIKGEPVDDLPTRIVSTNPFPYLTLITISALK